MGEYDFFENKGQWPNGVLYRAKSPVGSIWLEQGRILYHFTDYSELHHAHANPNHQATDEAQTTFKQAVITANFIGANPRSIYPKKI